MRRLLIIGTVFLALASVRADTVSPGNNEYSYQFHLYYDQGKLAADRDSQFKYDIVAAPYIQERLTTQYPYRGEIISVTGRVAGQFQFDPRNGDPKFVKGKISVSAPFAADGQKAVFYDQQNNPLLTISVSESSFCNDDGICNSDRGEDHFSCPNDCKAAASVAPLPGSGQSGSSGIILGLVYAGIGIGLLGILWWAVRRHRAAADSISPLSSPSGPSVIPPPPPQNTVQ